MVKKIRILYGLEAADFGALKHLTYLATNLDPTIFEITVIISTRRSKEYAYRQIGKMQELKIKVIVIQMERSIRPWKDLVSFLAIIVHMARQDYDIVHAHSSKAGVLFRTAAWMTRVPSIVYTPHCFYFQGLSGIKKKFYCFVERCMSGITDHIIVSNNERGAALEFKIAEPDKLLNINNAINFEDYNVYRRKGFLRSKIGLKEDNLVVGAIGRLVEQKDWLTYIYAAREVSVSFPNAIFLIVGDGELHDYLQNIIESLGMTNKIIITGYYELIDEIYAVIDIFVSSSLWEGLPYVLLEAMWFKKPIIATNIGYSDLIQDNENGFLVAVKDYFLIAERIGQLIRDQTLRKRMGERGYQWVKSQFKFEKFINLHKETYLRLFKNAN